MDADLYQLLIHGFVVGCAKAVGAGVLVAILYRIKI